jgi:DNA-binding ferritin-like protein
MRLLTKFCSTLKKVSKKKFYTTNPKEIKENETKMENVKENVKTVEELRREAIETEEMLKKQAETGMLMKKLTYRGIRFLLRKINPKSDASDCFFNHFVRISL